MSAPSLPTTRAGPCRRPACWNYKKQFPGSRQYQRADLAALEGRSRQARPAYIGFRFLFSRSIIQASRLARPASVLAA